MPFLYIDKFITPHRQLYRICGQCARTPKELSTPTDEMPHNGSLQIRG